MRVKPVAGITKTSEQLIVHSVLTTSTAVWTNIWNYIFSGFVLFFCLLFACLVVVGFFCCFFGGWGQAFEITICKKQCLCYKDCFLSQFNHSVLYQNDKENVSSCFMVLLYVVLQKQWQRVVSFWLIVTEMYWPVPEGTDDQEFIFVPFLNQII